MRKHKLGNKTTFILSFIVICLSASVMGFISVNLGKITDFSMAQDLVSVKSTALIILKSMGLLLLFSALEVIIKSLYLKKSMTQLKVTYMATLFQKTPQFFKNMKPSKISSNLISDADRLEDQYYGSMLELLWLIAQLIVSTVILVSIQPLFIVLILGMALIFFLMATKSGKPIQKEEKKKSSSLEKYTQFVIESLNGFEIIKQHSLEDERRDKFLDLTQDLKHKQYEVEKKTSLIDAANSFFQYFIILGLIVLGIYGANSFDVKLGSLMVIIMVFSDILWPLQSITPLITKMTGIVSVLNDYDETLFEESKKGQTNINTINAISFKDVTLSYDTPILEHVNLDIKENEKVLIVGPSGEGKSTLLKALMLDLIPTRGEIQINKHPLNTLDMKSYLSQFAKIDQKGFIFSSSLQDNITLLNKDNVDNVLTSTNLSHFEPSKMLQNDGDNISGGERARLMLARALYFDKPVLISDELFAALDITLAKQLEENMLKEERTLINVSHIVFEEHLDLYDKFCIVEDKRVIVSENKQEILNRMLKADLVIQ